MQGIHVLRAEKQAVAEPGLEFGQSEVGRVGVGKCGGLSAHGVELPNSPGVALESLGGTDVLDAVALPKAVGGAEGGQSALRTDACASKDEEAVVGADGDENGP